MRHPTPNALVGLKDVTAGENLAITWDFSAAHVGDCAVFISYDWELPLAQQQYFKIANLPKCKDQNRDPVNIVMPAWLPAGQAVLRWDWYALHQGPNNPEYYSQCVDLNIASSSTQTVESITKYPIIGIYPPAGNGAYRNAFGDGKELTDPGFIMTGPACADAMSADNNCDLTKDNGNGGDITGGGGGGTAPPPPPVGTGDEETTPPVCTPVDYTVVSGDSLLSIAEAHPENGVDWMQICEVNHLADCNVIEVGQVLTIPCDSNLLQQGAAGDDGGCAGLTAGVVIAILFAGAMIAFAIYKKKPAAMLPPEQVSKVEGEVRMNAC